MQDTNDVLTLLRALSRLDGRRADQPAAVDPAIAQERRALHERLPDEIARLYDRLFHSGRRPTVVDVAAGHCGGCHMRVPPQVVQLLTRAEVVCRCPNCHRFLSPPTSGRDERLPHA